MVSLGRTGTGRCFIELDVTSLRFAVVGAGRLGASLALALRARGLHLTGYITATQAGRLRAEAVLGAKASSGLAALVDLRPDLLLLTVPDSALDDVSMELAKRLHPGQGAFVAHASGSTSVCVLRPCAVAGATTFKFHPLQTFPEPTADGHAFEQVAVAVTPDTDEEDSPGAQVGFALARLLGARPFFLADADSALYHASATFASNYFVTLEHLARDLFVRAGLPADEALSMFLPLVSATLDNLKSKGSVYALTGPLSRGDLGTVRDHLTALGAKAEHILPLYRELGLATLDIVRTRGDVDDPRVQELAGLLRSPDGNLTDTHS